MDSQTLQLPKPSQGPSEEMRTTGFFNVHFVGKGETSDGKEKKAVGKFAYLNGDPGYQATSLMLLESALALLQVGFVIRLQIECSDHPPCPRFWSLQRHGTRFLFRFCVSEWHDDIIPRWVVFTLASVPLSRCLMRQV